MHKAFQLHKRIKLFWHALAQLLQTEHLHTERFCHVELRHACRGVASGLSPITPFLMQDKLFPHTWRGRGLLSITSEADLLTGITTLEVRRPDTTH